MKEVFTLEHSYENNDIDETKFIGIYSSELKAKNAVERLKSQPGFIDRPNDFHIDKYELNKDTWSEGYVTIEHIQTKDINGNWKIVQAEKLVNGNYRIIEIHENHLLGEFKNQDIVRCELRNDLLYSIEKIED